MPSQARGTFEVQFDPHPPYDTTDGITLGRVTIAKTFRGELEGTSAVEMLSAMTEVKGSAGYVAIERVVGSLHGKSGSFVLQHSGLMNRGQGDLRVQVVPDSGRGELRRLAGTMAIEIVDGQHRYVFDYDFAPSE
jgi:hypothetical protein